MKTANNYSSVQTKKLLRIGIITALILMIPLVAMQFSEEVKWSVYDFLFIGVLLFGAGLTYELIAKRLPTKKHRAALGFIVLAILILVWIELAVGIFGSPFAGS